MAVTKLHHAAYRCNDAQETADFYTKYLGLDYYAAVSEEDVPSTGEKCPYMHIFFAMKDGSCVAFFEVPASPPMQKDPNTPEWVQHLALNVESREELLELFPTARTFPQITIDGESIGGYTEFEAYLRENKY